MILRGEEKPRQNTGGSQNREKADFQEHRKTSVWYCSVDKKQKVSEKVEFQNVYGNSIGKGDRAFLAFLGCPQVLSLPTQYEINVVCDIT